MTTLLTLIMNPSCTGNGQIILKPLAYVKYSMAYDEYDMAQRAKLCVIWRVWKNKKNKTGNNVSCNFFFLYPSAPSPPESLRVVDKTITTLRIEWDSPASGLYRGFEVNISPATFLQELPRIVGSDIRGFTFVGLIHETEYTVSVTTIMGEEGLEEKSTTAEETVTTGNLSPGARLFKSCDWSKSIANPFINASLQSLISYVYSCNWYQLHISCD